MPEAGKVVDLKVRGKSMSPACFKNSWMEREGPPVAPWGYMWLEGPSWSPSCAMVEIQVQNSYWWDPLDQKLFETGCSCFRAEKSGPKVDITHTYMSSPRWLVSTVVVGPVMLGTELLRLNPQA